MSKQIVTPETIATQVKSDLAGNIDNFTTYFRSSSYGANAKITMHDIQDQLKLLNQSSRDAYNWMSGEDLSSIPEALLIASKKANMVEKV